MNGTTIEGSENGSHESIATVDHVDRDERPDEQASEAVHVLDREARPACERLLAPAIVIPSTATPLSRR